MTIRHILKPVCSQYIRPSFCTKSPYQQSVQVSVLGANTRLGIYTSFLMKQNPLISTLHLQGCTPIHSIGKDLNYMDTSCTVRTYCGLENGVEEAVKPADIVVILPNENLKEDTSIGERIMREGNRLHGIAVSCTIYAPRAVLLVCVPPVSVSTPLVSEVFKKTNFYHPGRIIGSTAFAQVKANTLVGRYQDLDPRAIYIPLIGGPDVDLAVPLFGKAQPVEVMGTKNQMALTARFRGVPQAEFPKVLGRPDYFENACLPESYGINMLVSTIALGLCGDSSAMANVFVRSNVVPACKYLVNTVRFSRGGVVHNYGIPKLTKAELDLLERASLEIAEREKMAHEFIDYVENKNKPADLPPFKEKENKKQELLKKRVLR